MEKIYNANSLIKKNLGTNYNITDNPLFLFYVENLRDSVHFKRPKYVYSKYYTNWKHLGFFLSIFQYINLYACFKQTIFQECESLNKMYDQHQHLSFLIFSISLTER